MDGDQHQRRQYEQPAYPRPYPSSAQNQPQHFTEPDVYGGGHAPRRAASTVPSQPFRHPQMTRGQGPADQAMSAPPVQRPDLGRYPNPQYFDQQLPRAAGQYAPRYSPETPNPLPFAPYTSQSLPPSMPQQPQSPYDPRPRYSPRHDAAAIEVLSTQFGPQPVSQHYGPDDPTNTSGPASLAHQLTAEGYQQPGLFPYQPVMETRPVSSNYVAAQMDLAQPAAPVSHQQPQGGQGGPDQRESLEHYQTQLKQTFGAIHGRRLLEACDMLLQLSEWLLTNVVELGLTCDDVTKNTERLKLWSEFNLCWLGLLQLQKDNTEKNLREENETSSPEMLTAEKLTQMGDRLIGWCDDLEKYGLVDWERAVWEEEIESILSQCLDLLDGSDQTRVGAPAATGQTS